MSKKKAIKITTATAIAASAFVAVAPTQSEAATSSVDKAITKATNQMAKAYDTYHKTAKNEGKLPATGTIRNEVKLAKDYYAAAEKEIAKNGGSKTKKAAYTKTLNAKKYFLDRAEAYLAAINTNLNPAKTAFKTAVETGKAKTVGPAKAALVKDVEAFEATVAKIYGPDVRGLLLEKYATPATDLANSVNDELKVYDAYKKIEAGKFADLEETAKLIDSVKKEADALKTKTTKLATTLAAVVAKNDAAYKEAYDAAQVPVVKEVSAINASQVVVKFNKLVDKTTAGDKANYLIGGSQPASVEVQDDETSVVLTLSAPYTEAKTVAAQVEGVKLKDSQDKFPLFAGTVKIEDKVNAQIKTVTGTTNGEVLKAVEVSYSEPVKAGAAIKIDGVKVAVTSAGVSQEISGLTLDASKEHTVEIVNLTDGANNVNPVASYKFAANKDVTAPAVKSVTGLNDNQFVVEFTEKVEASTVEIADFAVVKASTFASVTVNNVSPLAGDTTGTKFVVTTNLGSNDYASVNSIALNIALRDKAFKDVPGNESSAATASVTLTKDAVAPTLSSTVFEKNNDGEVTKVTLKFDEEVLLGTTMTAADLEVVQNNGVLQSSFFTNATVDGKNVVLSVKGGVKAGTFSVSLPTGFVVDKSIAANKSTATSTIVDFGKGETATTFTITKAEVTSKNEITVSFPTKVVGGAFDGSATSVDRYTVNGKPLPTGTKITLDSNQTKATIKLPAGTISSTDEAAVFQVTGVKALTGETSKLFTETLKVTDNVSPTLTSAQVLADGQTVVFTYDENVTVGTNLGSEFKFTIDGQAQTLADSEFTKVSASGKQVVAKVVAKTGKAAVAATAEAGGKNASKVTVTNGDKASKAATYNYTVAAGTGANSAETVVTNGTDEYVLTAGATTITVDGVGVAVAGATIGDVFTVTTTAPVASTLADVKFDTSKVISVETLSVTDTGKGDFDIEDAEGNNHKGEIKLTTTR
ncbi:hypothetical protein ABEV54_19445 [Peribacillus psychrosaccharolyticus]|uniref:hypothetical protein n=1 Tax=Peribacillus psychrosaccharolyticus TaxID=1407 RepID=UPI003D2DE3C6